MNNGDVSNPIWVFDIFSHLKHAFFCKENLDKLATFWCDTRHSFEGFDPCHQSKHQFHGSEKGALGLTIIRLESMDVLVSHWDALVKMSEPYHRLVRFSGFSGF